MKVMALVFKGIFAFVVSYLTVIAALAVVPSFLGTIIHLYYGDYQNVGTMFSIFVTASVLSSSMIYKHLKSLNIIGAR